MVLFNDFSILIEKQCKNELNKLHKTRPVHLYWTRGHNDNTGNEYADSLAKKGSMLTQNKPYELALNKNFLKQELQKTLLEKCQKEWDESPLCTHTKEIIKTVELSKEDKKYLLKKNRNQIKLIVSWISGHCRLNKHLTRMKIRNNPVCRFCEENEETPEHIIKWCGYFEEKRYEFNQFLIKEMGEPILLKHTLERWEFRKNELTQDKMDLILFLHEQIKERLNNDFTIL